MKRSDYKYTAFISYRHVEPDATIAAALHKAIETFKVPKEFFDEGKHPSFRVFRDREELSAKDLSDSIQDALKDSYYLIVISSKRTPLSEWCTREVELFRKLHGDDRIISVLIEGEPSESFSQPLKDLHKTIIDEAGEEFQEPRELLAADLRPEAIKGDSFIGYEALMKEQPALAETYKKEALKLLKGEIYRVMAAILGCTYGDLKQRDKERRQRQIIRVSAFFAALFLAFGLFMFRAYRQENLAKRDALQTNSALMLNQSQVLLDEGDRMKALLVARQAMSEIDDKMETFPVLRNQHEGILSEALYPVSSSIRTKLSTGNSMTFLADSDTGKQVAVGLDNDGVGLFDATTGELVRRLKGHSQQVKLLDFSPDGQRLITAGFDEQYIVWDVATGKILQQFSYPGTPMMVQFFGSDEFLIAAASKDLMLYRYTDNGTKVQEVLLDPATVNVKYDPKTQKLLSLAVSNRREQLRVYDFSQEEWLDNIPVPDNPEGLNTFNMIRLAVDPEAFYAARGGELFKLNRTTGKVLWQFSISSFGQELQIVEKKDGTAFFLANNSMLEQRDSATGALIEDYIFREGIIERIAYHDETDTLAASLNSGKVAFWQGGAVVESGVDLRGAQADEIMFSPDGTKLYVNSKATKEVLFVDIPGRTTDEPIEAQVVTTSPLGSYALMYDSEQFVIYDTATKQLVREIPTEVLDYGMSYLFDESQVALSEDGRWIMFTDYLVSTATDKTPAKRTDRLVMVDTVNEKEFEYPLPIGDYTLYTLPDSERVILAETDLLQVINLKGETLKTITPSGSVQGLITSQDGSRIGLNYEQGNAQVYDLASGEALLTVPGEILWIKGELVRGIYNRSVYETSGQELVYQKLPQVLDNTPVSNEDFYRYHEPSDQLLIIRNGPDKPVAFLLKYSTGEMRRKFSLPLEQYNAKGYFQQDGEVVLDQSFYSTGGYDSPLQVFIKSLRFHFGEYANMVEAQTEFLGNRELSSEERTELGLED